MIRRRLASEDGIVMIVAMLVLMVILATGLAIVALADSAQGPARDERQRTASGTLAEAALTAQVFQISRVWPGTSGTAATPTCWSTTPTPNTCPDPTVVSANFAPSASPDYNQCVINGVPMPSWTTWVRDNGVGGVNSTPTSYYTTAAAGTNPSYDSNNDGLLWVGASGYTSGCKLRRFVTLMQANTIPISVPRNVITANWLLISGKKKAIVDTTGQQAQPKSIRPAKKGQSAQAAAVQVRCNVASGGFPAGVGANSTCLNYSKDQVKPESGSNVPSLSPTMFTPAQLQGFRALAMADGKYYLGGSLINCPPVPTNPNPAASLTGKYAPAGHNIVFIENAAGCPAYQGGNDKNNPGFLVIGQGMLTLAGKGTYYGFIYNANLGGLKSAAVYMTGSAVVQGAVAVDGLAGVNPATQHTAIIFDPRGFRGPAVRGNAAALTGTWRELDANQ